MVRCAPGTSVLLTLAAFTTFAALASRAFADEPQMTAVDAPEKTAAQPEIAAPPVPVLQVAGPPLSPPTAPPQPDPHWREPPPPVGERSSDGAGPRLTFGRIFTEGLKPGFYGRFETEYFEVKHAGIAGVLLGLEGWGTEGATAGGGAIPISIFVGARGGPFEGAKAPMLFVSLGAGVDLVVYDRIGRNDGFGLFSPFGVATAGVEVTPGLRLLADGRAIYRWHWTSSSEAQYQIGLTIGLNSYLWDGP